MVMGTAAVVIGLWWAATKGLTGAALVSARFDALRVGLSIAVGSGGMFALYLAWRRQQSTEADLDNRERALAHQERTTIATQVHQERVATSNDADAVARRITELYTKAVEQFGSEKALIRLGGLYALERLAQDNVTQRQTIVNVLCAYLRMPYSQGNSNSGNHGQQEEAEVRLAIQRVLATHLRPGGDDEDHLPTFWPDVDIDLRGAKLVDLDFEGTRIREAMFRGAQFVGDAVFDSATFTKTAWFGKAVFTSNAFFRGTVFEDAAGFRRTRFEQVALFYSTTFHGSVGFEEAYFGGITAFQYTKFEDFVWFHGTAFEHEPTLVENQFEAHAPPEELYVSPSKVAYKYDSTDLNQES